MNEPRTIASYATVIMHMFRVLLPRDRFAAALKESTELGERLRVLTRVADGRLHPDAMTPDDATLFLSCCLDACAFEAATGAKRGLFDLPTLGDASKLGPSSDRRAKFTSGSDVFLEWTFQTLVQAWSASNELSEPKDLRNQKRFRGRRVCDFLIQDSQGGSELLECKRFHPEHRPADPVSAVTAKLVSRVDDAADQLRQSADVLKNASCCRHLLTDVSGYCTHDREAPVASKTVVVRGFNDDEIAGVGAALIDRLPEGDRRIDKMTLCWRNVTFVDGVAVAIAERALSVVRPNVTSIFNYSGWTVEGYPHRQSAYRDLQLSHGARSLDWIVTSFNNRSSPETFFKGGDEIRRV